MNKKLMSSIYMFVTSMVTWLGLTITVAIRPEIQSNKLLMATYQIAFAILFLGSHFLLSESFKKNNKNQ